MATNNEHIEIGDLPEDNDAIVIGAGLGGLSCALELARNGLKVCVLEAHRVAGGYAHAFRRKGYHFDVSHHFIGSLDEGQLLHEVLDGLGVLQKIPIKRRKTLFTAEFPDFTITLPNDEAGIIAALQQQLSCSSETLVELFEYLRKLKRHAISPWTDPDFAVPFDAQLSTIHRSDTFQQVLEKYVSDPKLLALLGQFWMYIGLPPTKACATFSASVFNSIFLDGAFSIVGGGAALVRAMIARLRELGSACITRSAVRKILIKNRKVTGVETERGEVLNAPIVVSNADPYQTFFELIRTEDVSKLYRFRLKHMESSSSFYALYFGLDCSTKELGIPQGNSFYNHSFDLTTAYERAMAGEVEHTDWCVVNYDNTKAAHYPNGKGIVTFLETTSTADWADLDQKSYEKKKKDIHSRLLEKYERRFPGLTNHGVIEEFATPGTMSRNTRNHRGSTFGLAQTVEQSGTRRLRNLTPVSGLYLTGAWTWNGGGYEGAIYSGLQSASVALDTLERPRSTLPFRLQNDGELLKQHERGPNHRESPPPLSAEKDDHFRLFHQVTVYGDEMNSRGFADASAFIRYLDRGRVETIESICRKAGAQSWLEEFVVNVYRIDAHTLTTAQLGHRLEVRTGLRKTSSHRASFDQQIINLTNGETVVEAVVEVLFLDQERKLVPVPTTFPEAEGAQGSQLSHERREPVEFSDDSYFPFRTQFRVYYEDTDAQGITYHVSYLRFCERALFELTRTAWPEISMGAWMKRHRMNVDRLDIRYLKATKLGDWLEVRTGARQLSSDRLAFDQRIVLAQTGQVVADAITDVVCRDEQERPAPIPAQLVDAYFEALPPRDAS